jgi:hypothetical protein
MSAEPPNRDTDRPADTAALIATSYQRAFADG